MKKRPNYAKVNEVFNGFAASIKGQRLGRRSDTGERP